MSSKFEVHTRTCRVSNELLDAIKKYVIVEDEKCVPGELRERNGWYYLTYLRVYKIKRFVPSLFELAEQEIDAIQATAFKFTRGKILVHGPRNSIKEISGLFEALVLKIVAEKGETSCEFDNYYAIGNVEVDLGNIVRDLEEGGRIEDIRKLKLKDMEVKIGHIPSASINTNDYGGARIMVDNQEETHAQAVDIKINDQEKTFIYVDVTGHVKCSSASLDPDFDVEREVLEIAEKL